MRDALFMALRSLAAEPWRALVMALGVAVALFLPAFTWAVGESAEDRLLQRARDTPIVLGSPGDEFDLVMASLYFRGQVRDPLPWSAVTTVRERSYGDAAPVYVAHSAAGVPVVGTTLTYLSARALTVDEGRTFAVLGEVLAGSAVAARLGLEPGDTLRSDLNNLYNLAGSYPLLLTVSGTLAATGGPDDEAFFADIKTIWALDGLIHGHEEVESESGEASPGIFTFDTLDEDTLASFHPHGDGAESPVSAILVFPKDAKAHDQLLGDLALQSAVQAVRPEPVVRTILGMVLRLQALLSGWVGLVGLSTAGFLGLTAALTWRLRAAEIALMRRMGCSRGRLAGMLGAELVIIVAVGVIGAAGLTRGGLVLLERLL